MVGVAVPTTEVAQLPSGALTLVANAMERVVPQEVATGSFREQQHKVAEADSMLEVKQKFPARTAKALVFVA